MRRTPFAALLLLSLSGCEAASDETLDAKQKPKTFEVDLGGSKTKKGNLSFRVYSSRATRIQVDLFDAAVGSPELSSFPLERGKDGVWSVTVTAAQLKKFGLTSTVYYGYRAWGPNWEFDPSWTKGSEAGFKSDVDADGNRFNPNKLLLDPYAFEMSHDPITPQMLDGTIYASGPHRSKDSGPSAPKGVVLTVDKESVGKKPSRPLKDDVIYEVHVRGLTMADPSVPNELRGTYAGAAHKAAYLKSMGITAVEFLPLQETQNDQNDIAQGTDGDNYWGYMTLSYFAPDRRYAFDKSPGGPTREFKQMVRAFHEEGIKVFVDVVYNHTGEGGLWDGTGDVANLLSFRGLDNPTYYELTGGNRFNYDNTGVGGNFNAANDIARNLILDSLRYWKDVLGVDGFRFDLASVLGNSCEVDCFKFDKFDPKNSLNRAVKELPARPAEGGAGADLIAEPWAIGGDSYQVGGFPSGWAEWNGAYRDVLRKDQNKLGSEAVTPGQLAARIAGSADLYADDGRRPWHSVNFVVAHDGFTLRDLYSFNNKNNNQQWPFGPSDGGEDHNTSWDQGGSPEAQRQAARTGLAVLMLSAGVPLITGGDEMYRTQYGNNNVYNLDSQKNWIDYDDLKKNPKFVTFSSRIIAFRNAHVALRPAEFFRGTDGNGNGLKDITWYTDTGAEADGGYMDNASNHFVAWRLDGTEAGDAAASIYVAYNGWSGSVKTNLPKPLPGKAWFRVGDTAAWNEPGANFNEPGAEEPLQDGSYDVNARSVLVLIER